MKSEEVISAADFELITLVKPWGVYHKNIVLHLVILGPTGYTPIRRKSDNALLVLRTEFVYQRTRRGAICARLACTATDSIALDYVAVPAQTVHD